MLMILRLALVVSTLLGVEAGEASFQAIGRKLVESVHLGRYDNGLRNDDVTDYVSAAEVWDNDEMLNLLGLDEDGKTEINKNDPKNFDTAAVPTLLSTLYQELNDPESKLNPVKCRMPGMKGNVVRMLNSKGKVLSQTQRTTVVELQFSMKNVLQPYENITEAKLKLSALTLTHIDHEVWDRMSGKTPQYKYEIYFAKESDMKKFRKKLANYQTSEQDTEFFDELGKPLIVEYISNVRSNKKLEINMKPLVKKWRKRYFEKKGRAINHGVLVVTMETDLESVTKQCFRAKTSTPRLLLVSQDRRQCPLPVTSYDDVIGDVVKEKGHVRQKRETRNEKKRKKERTKKTNDTKSVFDVPVPGFKYGHPDPVSEKHSDDVTGDVIKEGGHKRQDRGTRKGKKGGKGRKKNTNDTEIVLGVPVPGFDAGKPDPVRGRHTGQSRTTRSTICRRYPMYIRFDEVGWGRWIIAPRGYQAYRCAGECPFPLGGRLNGTNHAVLMTMMHSVEPWSTPQPCCVPTVLAPISLLYFDTTGNVVLRQYEDMVVSNCGCR